jgi:thymidine kinase
VAKLYFYYSTMNAGKSTSLLQSSHNYRERGMRTLVYTAEVDQRGGGKVHSRIGLSSEARQFTPGSDLYAEITAEHAGRLSVASYSTKRSS